MEILMKILYSVGVLLLFAMIVIWIGSRGFRKKVKTEILNLVKLQGDPKEGKITEKDISHLPENIKRWMRNSGVVGNKRVKIARLEEKGYMRLDPEKNKWVFASAKHQIGIFDPAFVWDVKAEMFPSIYIYGRDYYLEGNGGLEMRLMNLFKVADESNGHKINQSSFQRYLLELPWYPHAALNKNMKWTQMEDGSARVVMSNRGIVGEARYWFDDEGNVAKCSALRYKETAADSPLLECIGEVHGTIEFDGIRIPKEVYVTWVMPKGPFTWFKVEVSKAEYK
jgi:hypothetical protein